MVPDLLEFTRKRVVHVPESVQVLQNGPVDPMCQFGGREGEVEGRRTSQDIVGIHVRQATVGTAEQRRDVVAVF